MVLLKEKNIEVLRSTLLDFFLCVLAFLFFLGPLLPLLSVHFTIGFRRYFRVMAYFWTLGLKQPHSY
jgi:hypothetical protein